MKFFYSLFMQMMLMVHIGCTQPGVQTSSVSKESGMRTGAEQLNAYLPLLTGKRIAIVANQTSRINGCHLVDSLKSRGVQIQCVFAPEHGFRGEQGAGEKVKNGVDTKSGIQVISLYGKHLKPTQEDLEGIDLVMFDIQDVGARFYTYISTLQYVMEACAEQNKMLLILDRPNPNGDYVDGPVLDTNFRSFIGMNPIPVVHGMTIGEYAKMLNGEKWLKGKKTCKIQVIPVSNYTHRDLYSLPVAPSPNLPNMAAVYLYPSLCFFEGTKVSVGRGTDFPFQMIGYPGFKGGDTAFRPTSIHGKALDPPYEDSLCEGLNLREFMASSNKKQLHLGWLIQMYRQYPNKGSFFTPFFEKLSGTEMLRKQIILGESESEIRQSWQKQLDQFKQIRKKYLLYEDFE
ncbi:MAG: DUF1343 domain-containing protein [Bacteroidetes bacterium]|nr:DUF1343 domain-containing protein [Bacteroidota bacterium]